MNETTFLITHLIPHHNLKVDLGTSLLVKLDKERMDQVLTNLVSNAGKYSKAGSNILIKTRLDAKQGLILSVEDEGIGMDEVSIEKIFQKFHRDKQVINGYSGLGMGLYIASVIVEDHGGRIWVESAKDVGSIFYFSLPGLKN